MQTKPQRLAAVWATVQLAALVYLASSVILPASISVAGDILKRVQVHWEHSDACVRYERKGGKRYELSYNHGCSKLSRPENPGSASESDKASGTSKVPRNVRSYPTRPLSPGRNGGAHISKRVSPRR